MAFPFLDCMIRVLCLHELIVELGLPYVVDASLDAVLELAVGTGEPGEVVQGEEGGQHGQEGGVEGVREGRRLGDGGHGGVFHFKN